jgi:hypothetical protein
VIAERWLSVVVDQVSENLLLQVQPAQPIVILGCVGIIHIDNLTRYKTVAFFVFALLIVSPLTLMKK